MNSKDLLEYRHKNVHIVGLSSVEGTAICQFLIRHGFSNLTAHDFCNEIDFERQFMQVHVSLPRREREDMFNWLLAQPIKKRFKEKYLEGVESCDLIFATQAWFIYENNFPMLENSIKRGIPFCSITELYYDLAPCPIVAITGAHGKSTTTSMVFEILSASNRVVYLAGNDRRSVQVLDRIDMIHTDDILLLETSNRQLRGLDRSPHVAVITNVYPNHLDEHDSFDDYIATKRSILEYQGAKDFSILNYDNPITRSFSEVVRGELLWFTREHQELLGAYIHNGKLAINNLQGCAILGELAALSVKGIHNVENYLAAAATGLALGIEADTIWEGLLKFKGLKHRMQYVRAVKGVHFVDDLNSTTPHATIAAIRSILGRVHLIVGGDDKDLDYSNLVDEINHRVGNLILLPGKGPERIKQTLEARSSRNEAAKMDFPNVKEVGDLREAVEYAYSNALAGETILLSPACPYFYGMFYLNDSGTEVGFRALVREIELREVTIHSSIDR